MKNWKILVGLLAFVCLAAASISQNNIPVFTPGTTGNLQLAGTSYVSDNLGARSAVRIDSSTEGIVRFLPLASSSKESFVSIRVLSDSPLILGINAARPFVNLSSVTGSFLVM